MQKRKIAAKTIIISRVSTKRQQQSGYSLTVQTLDSKEYCTDNNLDILKIYEFAESATTGKRKKFMEAINFAASQKEIVAVVADKIARLQRSFNELEMLEKFINDEKIELHFCLDKVVIHKYSMSHERMKWNAGIIAAKYCADYARDNMNCSIKHKLHHGEWISIPPVGYLHNANTTKKGRDRIFIDPNRAPLIKRIFELYAKGIYTLPEILEKTKEWGLTNLRGNKGYLCTTYLLQIIQNPFYYGVMYYKKGDKYYPHLYEPIISKELFDKCAIVLKEGNKFKESNKDYIFRGLIKCANTGKVATSDTKQKTYANGNVGVWNYLRIWDVDNPKKSIYIPEKKVLDDIESVLISMQLEPKFLEKVINYIKNSIDIEQEYYKKRKQELEVESAEFKMRIDRIKDLFSDNTFSREEYEWKLLEYTQKYQEIKNEIEMCNKADDSTKLISLVKIASSAYQTFIDLIAEEKRKLINLIFFDLKHDAEKLHYKLRPPFGNFIDLSKRKWKDIMYDLLTTTNHRTQINDTFFYI
ncbi:resolvase, N terminal domain protein [Rickettsia felis str. Pedreira]|uniref:Resolvase, N terminal domain protein n=3 Tax=Rickettsia felis TaxID=42862 RepID=A0A0F3MRK4_RICFI|nr:recombinase family protein [Rickettsia felis]AAY61210.1 Site-specific recombinases [Rickettsia felis URRWXCal2]KJV58423.1 resolvase, N terminal domain protein [Rickettsia felis str. Pedreira]